MMSQELSLAQNPMRKIRIEKVLISCGAIEKNLEKSKKLLELISGMKAQITVSKKRIPNFGVTPDLEVGARVTLRGEKARQILSRLLTAINNTVEESQVTENHFSFGIREYIEIQGIEYQRDIGIRGLNATIVFSRPGLSVKLKKIKAGKLPKRQHVSQEEIIKFMEDNFQTIFV